MTSRATRSSPCSFVAASLACASVLGSACRQEPTYFHHGFKADILRAAEDGCDFGETPWIEWAAGPHDGFHLIGPERLADESLRWLESQRSESDDVQLDLVLSYPSQRRDVRVRWDPSLGATWEEQLRTWFERFPPTDEGAPPPDGFTWHLVYAGRGDVQGRADSARTATEAMFALADELEPHPLLPEPTYGLGFAMQTGPRESSWFRVDADVRDEIVDLPGRLLRQREHAGH